METSSTTTSGRSCATCSQAAWPSPASPVTSMSGWALMRDFNPSRTTAWSSARKTCSLVMAVPFPARGERNAGEDRGAVPGRRLDRQRPPQQGQAFLHPQQAQPPGGPRPRLRVEAAAVVLDDDGNLARGAVQDEADALRPGVLEHVGQRLLHDPV